VTQLRDGLAECAELARECQRPAQELGEPYRTCYETGASKVKNACINRYYDCIDTCRAANETFGPGGAAGTSGEAGSSGAPPTGDAGSAADPANAGAGGA